MRNPAIKIKDDVMKNYILLLLITLLSCAVNGQKTFRFPVNVFNSKDVGVFYFKQILSKDSMEVIDLEPIVYLSVGKFDYDTYVHLILEVPCDEHTVIILLDNVSKKTKVIHVRASKDPTIPLGFTPEPNFNISTTNTLLIKYDEELKTYVYVTI